MIRFQTIFLCFLPLCVSCFSGFGCPLHSLNKYYVDFSREITTFKILRSGFNVSTDSDLHISIVDVPDWVRYTVFFSMDLFSTSLQSPGFYCYDVEYGQRFDSNYVFVAALENGLSILNVDDWIQTYEVTSGLEYTRAVSISNDDEVVFIADDYGGFKIMDISSGFSGSDILVFSTCPQAMDVVNKGNLTVVADRVEGLVVFVLGGRDDSSPDFFKVSEVEWRSSIPCSGVSVDLDEVTKTAYVACFGEGLMIVDLSDPLHPINVGGVFPSRYVRKVLFVPDNSSNDKYVYLANLDDGVTVINVTNKTDPVVLYSHSGLGFSVRDILFWDGFLYIAAYENGIQVMDVVSGAILNTFPTDYSVGIAKFKNRMFVADFDHGMVTLEKLDKAAFFPVFVEDGKFCGNYSLVMSSQDPNHDVCLSNLTLSAINTCSGRGSCKETVEDPYICHCFVDYYGKNCEISTCDGILANDTARVCHSHGICDPSARTCNCSHSNYTGDFCQEWSCYDESNLNENDVCSGHGICSDVNRCECDSGKYASKDCSEWKCWGVLTKEMSEVCGGHGICADVNQCHCRKGYSATKTFGNCTEFTCGNYHPSDERVCNGRGICTDYNKCTCFYDFQGDICETWSCSGFKQGTSYTCTGHGECESPGKCKCNRGYAGSDCLENVIQIVLLSTLLPFGGIVFLFFLCCLLYCCCLLVFLVLNGICFLLLTACYQWTKIKKYSQLKNFDILLKEQENEDDMTVAHLRINKNLFEVNFEDIVIERVLGVGGSNSVVFLASWNQQFVAFKCFKTRMVCSSQERLEEFEKEVEVLASVSHPNVIRFFGATLQKPRIGILVEYCENGDLVDYLECFRKETDGKMVPIFKKIRWLMEVSDAMEYLHSRRVIHRDLKLENVVLDKDEVCKVMDFGLSTIVERMSHRKTSRIGTNLYMAPEVLRDSTYTEKCDIFSFGIFIYILMTQIFEPYGKEIEDVHIEVRVSMNPNFRPSLEIFDRIIPSGDVLFWVREAMVKCWDHNPSIRPDFAELAKLFLEKMGKLSSLKEGVRYLKSVEDVVGESDNEKTEEFYFESSIGLEKDLARLNQKLKEERSKRAVVEVVKKKKSSKRKKYSQSKLEKLDEEMTISLLKGNEGSF